VCRACARRDRRRRALSWTLIALGLGALVLGRVRHLLAPLLGGAGVVGLGVYSRWRAPLRLVRAEATGVALEVPEPARLRAALAAVPGLPPGGR
jgi:hypothetical protein